MRTATALALSAIFLLAGVPPGSAQQPPDRRVLVVRPGQLDPPCRIRVAISHVTRDAGGLLRGTPGMTERQAEWWNTKGERKYRDVCLASVVTADYLIEWSDEIFPAMQRRNRTITSDTESWGDVSIGRQSGTWSGEGTTTTRIPVEEPGYDAVFTTEVRRLNAKATPGRSSLIYDKQVSGWLDDSPAQLEKALKAIRRDERIR